MATVVLEFHAPLAIVALTLGAAQQFPIRSPAWMVYFDSQRKMSPPSNLWESVDKASYFARAEFVLDVFTRGSQLGLNEDYKSRHPGEQYQTRNPDSSLLFLLKAGLNTSPSRLQMLRQTRMLYQRNCKESLQADYMRSHSSRQMPGRSGQPRAVPLDELPYTKANQRRWQSLQKASMRTRLFSFSSPF